MLVQKGIGKLLTQLVMLLRPHSSADQVVDGSARERLYDAQLAMPPNSNGKKVIEGDDSPSMYMDTNTISDPSPGLPKVPVNHWKLKWLLEDSLLVVLHTSNSG